MRSLTDLLGSADGCRLLMERGVFLDGESFVNAMAPPRRDGLRRAAGLPGGTPIPYAGQQIQCDYPRSVTAKFRMLRDLEAAADVTAIILPLDTDRAGSSRWSTTLSWPGGKKRHTARLIPHRLAELETRFAPVEASRLEQVIETVTAWLAEPGGERLQGPYAGFVAALTDGSPRTLAEVDLALTSWLLRESLGFEPPIMLVSELVARGLLTEEIDRVVASIDDLITVFNRAVAELTAADVDPQVRPLPPDYLPLRYSCPRDGRRRRLVRERRGIDHFAVASCGTCGAEYRFHLGSGTLSIDGLVPTDRWSPDVTLPIYLNDLVSGVVAGQSTALYGLVLNQVYTTVLGGEPVPMLVPRDLEEVGEGGVDSLFFDCLTAST